MRLTRYEQLVQRDGECCYYCLRGLSLATYTEDHVIPRRDGGKNNLANIRLACYECNTTRGSESPAIWTRGCRAHLAHALKPLRSRPFQSKVHQQV